MLRKLSIITDKFKDLLNTFKTQIIYKTPAFKRKKKYLTVLRHGSDKGGWFYFVERLGKDSVAFVLHNPGASRPLGILKSFSSPYNCFVTDAFTGSLDKPENTILQTLIEEVKEEAGFVVTDKDCELIGSFKIGTSTNETVHCFLIDCKGKKQQKKEPENLFEKNTEIIWIEKNALEMDHDIGWRARMISYLAGKKGLL